MQQSMAAPAYAESDQKIGAEIVARGYTFDVVFDVGASSGVWTRAMSRIFPGARFEMFEPLTNIDANYQRVFADKQAAGATFRMHAVAVGDSDGETEIHVFPHASGSTTLPGVKYEAAHTLKVAVRSIDSLIADGTCPPPDFIKMDIQGGELAVLKGAKETLPHVTFLLIETWLQRGYGQMTPLLSEIVEFLTPFGFYPYEFCDVFRHQDDGAEVAAIDVWFINARKAKNPAAYLDNLSGAV